MFDTFPCGDPCAVQETHMVAQMAAAVYWTKCKGWAIGKSGENWHWEHGFASSGPRAISMQRSCTRMTGPASDSNVWLHWSQPVAFGDGELRRENLRIAMGVWDAHPADLLDVGRCSCIDFFVALSTLASWVPQVRRIHDAANHCCRSLCLRMSLVASQASSFVTWLMTPLEHTAGTPDPEMVLVITRGSSHFCVWLARVHPPTALAM